MKRTCCLAILCVCLVPWSVPCAHAGSPAAMVVSGGKGAASTFEPDANMERSAIPDLYKWRLDPLFEQDLLE